MSGARMADASDPPASEVAPANDAPAAAGRRIRLGDAFELAPDGMILADEAGTILLVSSLAARLFGYSPAELEGRSLDVLLPEAVRTAHRASLRSFFEAPQRRAMGSGRPFRARRSDGTSLLVDISLSPVRIDDRPCVVAAVRDVSESRRLEERLHVKDWAIEAALHAIVFADPEGRVTYVNPATLLLFGCDSATQLLGIRIGDIFADRPLDPSDLLGADMPETTARARRKDGSALDVRVAATRVRDEHGRPICSMVSFRDVSAEQRAFERLRRSERRLRRAQRAARLCSFRWRIGEDRFSLSGEFFRMFRLRPAHFNRTYAGFLRLVHSGDRPAVDAAIHAALRGESEYRCEFRILCNGRVRHVIARVRVAHSTVGRPLRMEGVLMDVTRRRALERRLRQAQKLEALGRLAGGIAHDFNNLLTTIGGNAAMLQDLPGLSDEARRDLAEIERASERAASLTHQLLAFGRRQVLRPVVLNVNDVVAEAMTMLARVIGEHIAVEVDLDPHLGAVELDPGQLEQVVMNLVLNARDAMPAGGTLRVETCNAVADVEPMRRRDGPRQGSQVQVVVRDTGTGMDEQTVARVFEPFFTTKKAGQGSGLGLATVYGIVRQSGGSIRVESEPGRGSVFTVCLPQVNAEPDAADRETRRRDIRGHETVLIVEDEAGVLGVARRALDHFGYTVLAAASAREALRLVRRFPGSIDLVLSDVVLPGCSGPRLMQRIRARRPGVRVVFMSGYAADDELIEAIAHGGEQFLAKPFTPAQLVEAVRAELDHARDAVA